MSKKVAIWGSSLVAGMIATYLLLFVLGIPAERYGTAFFIGTTFFFGLLFVIPMDHVLKAGILGQPTSRKKS